MDEIYKNSRDEWIGLAEWLEEELRREWGALQLDDGQAVWKVATTEISGNEAGFFIFKSHKFLGEKFDNLCIRASEKLKALTIPWVIYCFEYRNDGKNWICSDNPVVTITSGDRVFAEPIFSRRVIVNVSDAPQ